MRILITGGSGFIGRNLAELLGSQPISPKAGAMGTPGSHPITPRVAAPGTPSSDYEVLAPNSAELNLLNEQEVRGYLDAHRFDVVVHAATTRSNRRAGAPADMLDRNCRMFFNLARNQGKFGKMIYFGSGAEYGPRVDLPARVREEYFDTQVPQDAYGFSKYICAKYIEARGKRSEVRGGTVELRLFGVFGPYEDYTVRFISNACCRALKGLPIVLRQDVMFDYLYVKDLAAITEWFIENDARQEAYNVCSGNPVALTEVARMVTEISGRNPEILVAKAGMGEAYTGDNARLKGEMGEYRLSTPDGENRAVRGPRLWDLRDAIQDLYSWYVRHEAEIDVAALRFDE